MISLYWEKVDWRVLSEGLFKCLRDINGVFCDFSVWIWPDIVGWVVAGPGDKVDIKIFRNEIEHVFEGSMR